MKLILLLLLAGISASALSDENKAKTHSVITQRNDVSDHYKPYGSDVVVRKARLGEQDRRVIKPYTPAIKRAPVRASGVPCYLCD